MCCLSIASNLRRDTRGSVAHPAFFASVAFVALAISVAQAQGPPILEFSGGSDQLEKLGEPPFSIHAEIDYTSDGKPHSSLPQLRCEPLVEGKLLKAKPIQSRLYEADLAATLMTNPCLSTCVPATITATDPARHTTESSAKY
jgi:hypothetical protein